LASKFDTKFAAVGAAGSQKGLLSPEIGAHVYIDSKATNSRRKKLQKKTRLVPA